MFQGRYGNDHLNRALAFFAIGVSAITLFLPYDSWVRRIILGISTVCIVVILVRMFSRDFTARQKENAKWLEFWGRCKNWFAGVKNGGTYRAKNAGTKKNPTFEDYRKYKYLVCPQCAQRLRVPRGKGKLRVTCTRCGNKFEVKS